MIEKRGELYTCKEHPELNVGRELAWEHLKSYHPKIAGLELYKVPAPDPRPRSVRRREQRAERRAERRKP